MERLLKADTEERLYNIYTADCMGMLLRQLYGVSEFKLYSEYISLEEHQAETAEQVMDKILRLLDGAGKEVVAQDECV